MTTPLRLIQQRIKESMILDQNEPVLSLVQVSDYLKFMQQYKKVVRDEIAASLLMPNKNFYLFSSIKITDNDSKPLIYLVKLEEKTNDLKLKFALNLNEIVSIGIVDDSMLINSHSGSDTTKQKLPPGGQDYFKFEFILYNDDKRFVWQCDREEDRYDFVCSLWKLSEQYLKVNERPKFINFKYESKSITGQGDPAAQGSASNNSTSGNANSIANQMDITKSDEDTLLKLMDECDFASSNAEKFMQKLQSELEYLDTSNIESIMNSEENTLKLIQMLDEAVTQIDVIDDRLKVYEDKINAVGDAVRMVGERDNVIQLQQKNQHDLLEKLDGLMSALQFSPEKIDILSKYDFSTPTQINRCVRAANDLIDILESEFLPGFKKMKAYEEQTKFLEQLKIRFCSNSQAHLKDAIAHTFNNHLKSYKVVDNSLASMPSHKQVHDALINYKDLMAWLFRSNCQFNDRDQKKTYYNDIKQYYIVTWRDQYLNEINPFCYCAKSKILKNDKNKANASMENIKGSFIKPFDKNHPGDVVFSIRIDQTTKDTFKAVFNKLMNQLSTIVQGEQAFCQEFFGASSRSQKDSTLNESGLDLKSSQLSKTPSTASNLSTINNKQMNTSASATSVLDSKTEMAILTSIFEGSIEDQIRSIMESIIKTENMMVIFIYSDLLNRVLVCFNNKSYMHQPLVRLLRISKEKCDEFVTHYKEMIRDYKFNKREKIGILRYVWYFEEFVKESEACWEPIRQNMYEKLCLIYQQLVNEIFKGIESVAAESQKTPPDIIRLQNYHQMLHILRSINGLKDSAKYAKDQYKASEQSYIKEYFGKPLEKLSIFFEKVEAKIESGIRPEDISYRFELSANNLQEIIHEYPAKEVKKGLYNLYNKVQKHIEENSNLLQVVWLGMSNEFLKQYENYERLIKLCYPGQRIMLEFTKDDVFEFFSEISKTQ